MLTSNRGFTVVEMLIAVAIVGFVLTGIYSLAISSSRFYIAQNAIVEMQADGRAAMDFMARELRTVFGTPVISTAITANDTISFDRVEETGYSSGANSTTTLNDTRKTWQSSGFAKSSSATYMVRIIAGTGTGQARTIDQNTVTRLTISPAWGVTPDGSSFYLITVNKGFTRTSSSDRILRYRIGAAGDNNPLVENINSHSFALLDPNTVRVTLTARTRAIDPTTNQYRLYTISEDVRTRN
jgi:prepilin-type N-terminal cleavage/methylation domain-containing protein